QLKLFLMHDDDQQPHLEIKAIHDDDGYRTIRDSLSKQYNLSFNEPNIQVFNVNLESDRTLILHYYQHHRVPLSSQAHEVLKHLYTLWKFPIKLIAINEEGHP
ncbi:MAG TPA: SpoVR family protein, partial [Legionellales bacterium]|nr:SpoVR family protein [Legionellales bacterium]